MDTQPGAPTQRLGLAAVRSARCLGRVVVVVVAVVAVVVVMVVVMVAVAVQ